MHPTYNIHIQNIYKHDSKPRTELDHARTRNPTIPTSYSTLLYIPNTKPLFYTHLGFRFQLKTQTTYSQHNPNITQLSYPNTEIIRSLFPLVDLLLFFSSSCSLVHTKAAKIKGKKREILWDHDEEMQEVYTMEDFLISLPEFRSREGKRDL